MSEEIREILEHQANMDSLWHLNPTIGEAILQAALRHLTAVLQNEPGVAMVAKDIYWNCDSEL